MCLREPSPCEAGYQHLPLNTSARQNLPMWECLPPISCRASASGSQSPANLMSTDCPARTRHLSWKQYGCTDPNWSLYEAFIPHKGFYIQKLSHTATFIHRSFYTQILLHRTIFTDKNFCTYTLSHTEMFIDVIFYRQNRLQT